ncbi:hypothetical protein NU10_08425 [Flavobacterium dauae]|uniref:hypothetical protein n=1 Tax=Flavobacterium dauae TaxID=1563479 RepID=UPI00101B468A|nr:hypothetical protein [Flavobacterium dauae]WLD22747.1 hypothetical protein NU10_08425 [Flavobacterium dauae]
MKKIQTGFLVSYDYQKLKKSIPSVYKGSDEIFLALDYKNRTWTGNEFKIEESFFSWIEEIDVDKKIIIYRDDFYIPELSPIENDTRERQMLGEKMGIGNWIIQVDSDEIFIDFIDFVKKLRKYDRFLDQPINKKIQIAGFHINAFKYLEKGLLFVDEPTKFYVATNYPNYKCAKNTREQVIYINSYVLHEGLARTESELRYKLENWGHKDEINNTFLDKWLKANEHNYHKIKDVFYLNPKTWKSLGYFPSENLNDIKEYIIQNPQLKKSKLWIFKKNFGQWFKHLFK